MAKKRKPGAGSPGGNKRSGAPGGRSGAAGASTDSSGSGASLKELLNADVLGKLKAQSEAWKQDEQERKEAQRKQQEEAKLQERKRLENDFEYLLNNSDSNWSKYK